MKIKEKACFKCGVVKPITDFYVHPSMGDGRAGLSCWTAHNEGNEMPATTMLNQCELDQPTGNAELDRLLADAKAATGDNYHIVMRPVYGKRHNGLWTKTVMVGTAPQLYLEVSGVFPWQEMQCAHDERTVFAYLYGLVNGATNHAPP